MAIAGVLALWLIGWLGVPPLMKWQLEKQGRAQLGRTVSVERVTFEPWALALTIEGFRVADASGAGDQFTLQRLYIDAEIQSLMRLAPVIDAIAIEQPRLNLRHLGGGRYDVDDILQRLAQPVPAEPGDPSRFALYNIRITGGEVTFVDEPLALTHRLDKLALAVPFLSNLPSRREVVTQPQLSFALNGSAFDSRAASTPFAEDRQTEASLDIPALDLAPFLPYWPAAWPVRPTAGVLELSLKLAFEQRERPQVVLSGTAALAKLRVQQIRSGGSPTELLAWDRLAVAVRRAEPLARRIDMESVALQGPRVALSREPGGRINLQAVLDAWPAEANKAAPSAATAPAWAVELGSLTVADGTIAWRDAAVQPATSLSVDQLTVSAQAIAWPVREPVPFEASARLGDTPIRLQGSATDAQAKAVLSLADFPLSLVAPYLAETLVPALDGRLTTELALRWQAPTGEKPMGLGLSAARIALDELALGPPRTPLASLKQLRLSDVSVDLAARSVELGEVLLERPRLKLVREKDGGWMAQRWLKPAKPSLEKSAPWALAISQLTLNNGELGWEDQQPGRAVALQLTGVQLDIKDLKPLAAKQAPMPLRLQLRLAAVQAQQGDPARLRFRGAFRLPVADAPSDPGLLLKGDVQAERLPLHALEPYFGDRLNLELLRADASYRGSLNVGLPAPGLTLALAGDLALEDFRANTLAPSEELLNWKSLNLRGLALDISPAKPLRLSVGETVLSDYFARVIVQANGRLNLQGLVKEDEVVAPNETAGAAVSAARPVAPAVGQPDIRFGPIGLVNGRVFFSDRFIQPNYSANLSELTGGISAFASAVPPGDIVPALADLTLKGRAEGTAQLDISGKVNPLARPLALDIQGMVRDLELPPLSPYSAKYAGYGIERGKLSVNVAYQIDPSGQLSASNQIVLNQLSFGDRVAGSDAPNLSVKLAVALLADRQGVIDINLPVSGSINDPQFRLGPIIWRLVLNLIGKAITAPFSLIAGALGGGDELSRVDFAPGGSVLDEAGRKRLDTVAKALADRPALQLTVIGQADLAVERSAYQRAQLQRLLLAEKRRELARSGANIAGEQVVTPEEAPALLRSLYRRADMPKPRNAIGIAKDIPVPEMEALLLAAQPVSADAMRELAVARGVAVKDYLATRALPESRMFLGAPVLSREGDAWRPQAELKLAPR
jgi:uncharacterized protein involved in outer membrane biogenesis